MTDTYYHCQPWKDGERYRCSDTDGNVVHGDTPEEAIRLIEDARDEHHHNN